MCQMCRWLKELGPAEFALRMSHSDFQTDGHKEAKLPFPTRKETVYEQKI